jgi:hypothetical protein
VAVGSGELAEQDKYVRTDTGYPLDIFLGQNKNTVFRLVQPIKIVKASVNIANEYLLLRVPFRTR